MEKELDILEQKYKEISANLVETEKTFYEDVMSKTTHKKISRGPMLNIRPFGAERVGFKLSKELKKFPKSVKNVRVYYFDSDDNVLLIEIYGHAETIINREYYFYTENRIESIYFNSGAYCIRNIDVFIKEGNLIKYDIAYAMFGKAIEEYIYDGETLMEIDVKAKGHQETEYSFHKFCFEYKEGILDKIIQKHPNGYENQEYP